ncbi:mitochondrial-processing peptidase subunit beta [Cryptococcus neoformans Ze90-1]|nr:mitochondrial-processing peptidase subunit beta [Cryptococcus neoformans var. grubii Ze90-1]
MEEWAGGGGYGGPPTLTPVFGVSISFLKTS